MLVIGGYGRQSTTEMINVGKDSAWTSISRNVGYYPFAAVINNEVFIGPGIETSNTSEYFFKLNVLDNSYDTVRQWNKTSLSWQVVRDVDYTRYGYSHIGSSVPLSSGVENWCLSNSNKRCSNETEKTAPLLWWS